ncbi:N-acetyl-alpha-D-glucosaminyl L-malate synthase BshA [Caldinitratiruptor microaerophilus]|uniref:N-acetyl-alpha-D-glucosaminyl L-malate synthase BshA n=1 Tax=Caldinitratiruptor microaerophilus TaxID=671077 RepID=A0AA35CJG1_9FIRM|nr:N-acetyl-alpha-D-glucosaminyl L-malate synthase BshA [Caldinitratiruptor microaerophilus]BDG59483.1 N-acetyl-alpha-D-glucosaminyl L-malate synthase BshA [Caldinitratiruptor microaerophilus]
MKIAIVCYPTVGGSGVVATELGKHLARRGHEVHFISSEPPFRLRGFRPNVAFHQVDTPSYYLFKDAPYLLSLANKIAEVHRHVHLDVVHAHYAIPHATAAYLAREMTAPDGPRVVTTLHGTDITLMGQEPSYAGSIAFAIEKSDGVTAVSEHLRRLTVETLGVRRPIVHIPNFLDCDEFRPAAPPGLREQYARPGERIVAHLSNMRPVKRVDRVVEIFARIAREVPARLLLIGDGPECPKAWQLVREKGLTERVYFLGNQDEVVPLLSIADVFLLPSIQESFGLAALEAMACGTPVVASRIGGLPEVVGETGYLLPPDDVDGMVAAALRILTDAAEHDRLAASAVVRVREQFCADRIVPRYEAFYRQVLG